MHLVASMRVSACLSKLSCLTLRAWLCRVQQRAKKIHYHQSKVFVCALNNRADAVDRLLICYYVSTQIPDPSYFLKGAIPVPN